MQLFLSDNATRDIEAIHQWYFDENPLAAVKIINRIDRAFLNLSYFPNIGIVLDGEIRGFTVPKTKYRVLYAIEPERIIILRVWQAQQEPPEAWRDVVYTAVTKSTTK